VIRKYETDHAILQHEMSSFVYENCRLLKLPSKVLNSVKYFLAKINNGNLKTKSVKKLMSAIILATRAQKYTISIEEIQSFFYERYKIKFKWGPISKILVQFNYKALRPENYLEKTIKSLGLSRDDEIKLRKTITLEKKSNPIIDSEITVYRALKKLGLVNLRGENKNGNGKISQAAFTRVSGLRNRIYHSESVSEEGS